jgi:hypothetical protein
VSAEPGEQQAGVPAADAPSEIGTPEPWATQAESAAPEPLRSEPVSEEQSQPEPAVHLREPESQPKPEPEPKEPKESRPYLNGNGAAHTEEPVQAENTEDSEDLQVETAVAAPPKPRGTKRGWWQRRE